MSEIYAAFIGSILPKRAVTWANKIFELNYDDLTLSAVTLAGTYNRYPVGADSIGGLVLNSSGVVQAGGAGNTLRAWAGNGVLFRNMLIQIEAGASVDINTITDYVDAYLVDHVDFNGQPVRALKTIVNQKTLPPGSAAPPQCTTHLLLPLNADPDEYYTSFYFHLAQSNLDNLTMVPNGNWLALKEAKMVTTGPVTTVQRIVITVRKDLSTGLYYFDTRQDAGSGAAWWNEVIDPDTFPIVGDKDYKIEMYYRRPKGGEADESTGITKVWITPKGGVRTRICNKIGGKQFVTASRLHQLMLPNIYSGGYAPYSWISWGMKLYDGYPLHPSTF